MFIETVDIFQDAFAKPASGSLGVHMYVSIVPFGTAHVTEDH